MKFLRLFFPWPSRPHCLRKPTAVRFPERSRIRVVREYQSSP